MKKGYLEPFKIRVQQGPTCAIQVCPSGSRLYIQPVRVSLYVELHNTAC